MNTIITDMVVLLAFLAWGTTCCRLLQVPRAFSPVLGISAGIVILHLAGTFGHLYPGAIGFLIAGPLLWLVVFHKSWKDELRLSLSTGAVIGFLLACVLLEFVYLFIEPFYCQWDELSHWGIFYKSVFYYHNFTIYVPNEIFVHPSYPQGAPALYAAFAVLKNTFLERDTYFSLNTALFACSSALFSIPSMQRGPKRFLTLLAILGTPFALSVFSFEDAKAYTTIYLDIAIGAFFGAALCLLCIVSIPSHLNTRHIIAVGILCGACVALKDMGLIFTLCVLGVAFLATITQTLSSPRDKISAALKTTAGIAILPLLVLLAWKIALSVLDRGQDQFSNMSGFIQSLEKAYHGEDSYFFDVLSVFGQRILTGDLILGQSTFFCGLICIFLSIALTVYFARKQLLAFAVSNALMPIYGILYLFVLFYVYICGMSRAEGLRVASFERYVGTFFIAWLFLIVTSVLFIGISHFLRPAGKILLITLLAGELANITYATQYHSGDSALSFGLVPWRKEEIEISSNLLDEFQAEPGDLVKVYSLSASDPWPRTYYYRYELWPYVSVQYKQSVEQSNISDFSFLNSGNTESEYLLLFGVENQFAEQFRDLFSDQLIKPTENLDFPALYRVVETNGSYVFELCN